MRCATPICLSLLLLCSAAVAEAASAKTVIGRVERLSLPKHELTFEARVDTGAHTSSLHVTNHEITTVGKNKYIEFDTEDRAGNVYHLKTRVHKESLVRGTTGKAEKRYVIREEVTLGKVTKKININLNDRTSLKYNFLIGRNLLRGDFIVDVARSHVMGE